MKAYIIRSHKIIEPFKDNIYEVLIGNEKLSEIQEKILSSLCIPYEYINKENITSLSNEEGIIIFHDNLYFSKELLENFIKKTKRIKSPCRLTLNSKFYDVTASIESYNTCKKSIDINFFYYPPWSLKGAKVIICEINDIADFIIDHKIPQHLFNQSSWRFVFTSKIAIEINCWADLLLANIYFNRAIVGKLVSLPVILKLWLCFLSRSLNQHKILNKFNKIGKDCDIHPTAYIEGSNIGDNVTIGANTLIRCSTIGNDVYIGENSNIQFSSIGDTSVLFSIFLYGSIIYPCGVISTDRLVFSIVGHDAYIGQRVSAADYRVNGKEIPIKLGKQSVATNLKTLGICVGHRARIGMNVKIGEGLTIPNEYEIHPIDTLTYIAEDLPKGVPLFVVNKNLRFYPTHINFFRKQKGYF